MRKITKKQKSDLDKKVLNNLIVKATKKVKTARNLSIQLV